MRLLLRICWSQISTPFQLPTALPPRFWLALSRSHDHDLRVCSQIIAALAAVTRQSRERSPCQPLEEALSQHRLDHDFAHALFRGPLPLVARVRVLVETQQAGLAPLARLLLTQTGPPPPCRDMNALDARCYVQCCPLHPGIKPGPSLLP